MKVKIELVNDGEEALDVINSAAKRYERAIPEGQYSEPYMSGKELRDEMEKMKFYGLYMEEAVAVVGVQELGEVTLIRHLYVMPELQRAGLGTGLLECALDVAWGEEVLVGTWRDADWAVSFYEENGFELVEDSEGLLREYWDIPERQVEESVVLRYREDEDRSEKEELPEG